MERLILTAASAALIFSSISYAEDSHEVKLMKASATNNSSYENWYESQKNFKKPSEKKLKETLTALQYKVTQKEGTEGSFNNTYWDNKKEGIYVDIVSGEPLFSSTDKYKSGTGWPSFTRSIDSDAITTHEDFSLFGTRVELRSKVADSHLGHVFNDGPAPTRLRYCINSASLRFIEKKDLAQKGYGEFASLFE